MKRPEVVVFFGGEAANHDLSTETGYWVCQYLPRDKYNVTPVRVAANGDWQVPLGSLPRTGSVRNMMKHLFSAVASVPASEGIKKIFDKPVKGILSVLRGKGGDDGGLAGLAHLTDVKVAGSSATACATCGNKNLVKQAVGGIVPGAKSRLVRAGENLQSAVLKIRNEMTPPLFIKPISLEGSVGMERVESSDELTASLGRALRQGDVLIEEEMPGQELCIALHNGNLLPTTLIESRTGWFDALAKRQPARVNFGYQTGRESKVISEAEEIARGIYDELGLTGYADVNLKLTDQGLRLLEVNTVPVWSSATPLSRQIKMAGVHPTNFWDDLIGL